MAGEMAGDPRWRMALVGVAYAVAAWVGSHLTLDEFGLAVVWPANAVLLAAFLLFPLRQWPLMALAALLGEVIAAFPSDPWWAPPVANAVNLFETALAAALIRRFAGDGFDFDSLRSGCVFLLAGPLLAAATASLFGAAVLDQLQWADSSFPSLWRLWWFGDFLGLVLFTPLIVVLWRWLQAGIPAPHWPRLAELALLWSLLALIGFRVFRPGDPGSLDFHLTPLMLLPFAVWAAARLGVHVAALTVVFITMLAVGHLSVGLHPYGEVSHQYAVWLIQEYLAILALISLGLAILLRELRERRDRLEQHVRERTASLSQANEELYRANKRLRELVLVDHLTGIANRRSFHQTSERMLARLAREGGTAALIMLDLDNFKEINDRYGHEAGDAVLQGLVAPVREVIRPLDLFARMGGEEFLILLPDAGIEDARRVAERIRRAFEALRIEHKGRKIAFTSSFGVAGWDGASDLDKLISRADRALYAAKHGGRNKVSVAG